jgi:hypothetical protein
LSSRVQPLRERVGFAAERVQAGLDPDGRDDLQQREIEARA